MARMKRTRGAENASSHTTLRSLALLAGAAMAAQAALAWAGGAGFLAPAKLVLVSSSLLFVPLAWAARSTGENEGRAFAAACVAYWLALIAAGFWLPEGWPSALALALVSGVSALGAAAALRSAAGRRPGPVEFAALAALVLYGCGTWWSSGHKHPDIEAHLARAYLHVDALYFTSVSAMIRSFGQIGLGLDGLTPLRWHFLTPGLLAAAGKMAATPQLVVHAVFYPMFAPTLFAFGLAAFADRFRRAAPGALAFIVVCLAGWMLPGSVLGANSTWDPIGSETFAAALTLFFLGALRQPLEPEPPARGRADFLADCAWVLTLVLAKVSVGFLAAGWLTMQRIHDRRLRLGDFLELGLLWASFMGVLSFTLGQSSKAAFHPLWFVLAQIGLPPKWPAFFLVHWLPLWVGLAALALRRRDWFSTLRADRYFMTLVAPAWVVGVASFNFTIRGGSGVYFSMLAPVFAIPWACAHLLEAAEAKPRAGRAALAAALATAVAFQLWPNARGLWSHLARGVIDAPKSPEGSRAVSDILALRAKLSVTPRCGVYVSNRTLVQSPLNKDIRCFEIPFYYTGVLERPLLLSWMTHECRTTQAGFWWGHSQSREQPPESPTDAQLCASARQNGLSCVEKASGASLERLACP